MLNFIWGEKLANLLLGGNVGRFLSDGRFAQYAIFLCKPYFQIKHETYKDIIGLFLRTEKEF